MRRPLLDGVNAEHVGVGGERAGADAEHGAPARHVVELRHAVGDHQRVVVRQADDAGAELDVLRPLRRRRHEQLRRGDSLPPGAVVFAYPRLVEVEIVEPLDQLEIPLVGDRRIFVLPVKRRHENAELHAFR